MSMRAKPWDVSDALWERIEPLLPRRERRFRYPGRKPFDDRLACSEIDLRPSYAPASCFSACAGTLWAAFYDSVASAFAARQSPRGVRPAVLSAHRRDSGRGVKLRCLPRPSEHRT